MAYSPRHRSVQNMAFPGRRIESRVHSADRGRLRGGEHHRLARFRSVRSAHLTPRSRTSLRNSWNRDQPIDKIRGRPCVADTAVHIQQSQAFRCYVQPVHDAVCLYVAPDSLHGVSKTVHRTLSVGRRSALSVTGQIQRDHPLLIRDQRDLRLPGGLIARPAMYQGTVFGPLPVKDEWS